MNVNVLQIGAHNGISANNRYVLEKLDTNKDATSIFVEPVSELFNNLVINLNSLYTNNRFIFLNMACSNTDGYIELYMPDVPLLNRETEQFYIENGYVSWLDQLASFLPNHVKDHNINNVNIKTITTPCITLNTIINRYGISSIELLSIDTEGHDYEILNNLDFSLLRPKQIRFEHKHMEGTNITVGYRYNTIIDKLISVNYEIKEKNSEDTVAILRIS